MKIKRKLVTEEPYVLEFTCIVKIPCLHLYMWIWRDLLERILKKSERKRERCKILQIPILLTLVNEMKEEKKRANVVKREYRKEIIRLTKERLELDQQKEE